MARNDGIDRTVARNQDLPTPDDVAKIQEHNEREKDSYSNQDIPAYRHSPEYRLPQTAYQDFYFAFWQASNLFKLICKLNVVFHTSRAALSASILE